MNLFGARSSSHFDQAVRAYSAELYHFALWITRDRHRAEDVVQEALTRAWRSWTHLKDESARRGWLYAIVRNEAYREMRGGKREAELDEEALAQIADERDFTRGVELRQIMERLPQRLMEPLVMQNVGGLSCEEIAHVLGVSVGAAMTRISRARSALRELLREPEPCAARSAAGGER